MDTNIALRRLHSLGLSDSPWKTPEEVVGRLGAVQSQDHRPAKWSVAQRTGCIDDAVMDTTLADGAILRTHVLRPTWHFVVPADILWMLQLTGPRVRSVTAHFHRRNGLDPNTLGKCIEILVEVLGRGRYLTRAEIASELESHGVLISRFQLGFVLMEAELKALICSGPLKGRQQTYALLVKRAPQARRLKRDEALDELTRRYFTSHGPATAKDFAWWSSLTLSDVMRGLEIAAPHVAKEDIDGVSYWAASQDAHGRMASPMVHLLQAYDELLVGYSQSKYVVDSSGLARSASRDRGIYVPTVVLDGQIVGRWKSARQGESLIIDVDLYKRLDEASMLAVMAAGQRFGQFLGSPTEVRAQIPSG